MKLTIETSDGKKRCTLAGWTRDEIGRLLTKKRAPNELPHTYSGQRKYVVTLMLFVAVAVAAVQQRSAALVVDRARSYVSVRYCIVPTNNSPSRYRKLPERSRHTQHTTGKGMRMVRGGVTGRIVAVARANITWRRYSIYVAILAGFWTVFVCHMDRSNHEAGFV